MTRYHPLLVALHWILALMILVSLVIGGPGLERLSNADPAKVSALAGHMIFGSIILILMIVRLITRVVSQKPAHVSTGNAIINQIGIWIPWVFYLLVFGVCLSGIGISVAAGLPDIVFFGSETPLPESFWDYPARTAHYVLTTALLGLIAVHVTAALFHQLVMQNGLISRMWFGKRSD